MAEVSAKWSEEEILSEAVSKQDIVIFLQTHGSIEFLRKNKLYGKESFITKNAKKPRLLEAYKELFATKQFRTEEDDKLEAAKEDASAEKDGKAEKVEEEKPKETPKFRKIVSKKGDKLNIAKKGDFVSVRYTGKLADGTVFDSNLDKKKHKEALKFRLGDGKVIRGWEEAMIGMALNEQATITIEPEWAYGKKEIKDGAKVIVPANSELTFTVEVVGISSK